MNYGSLIISLDFELLWGVFDSFDTAKSKYFENTRKVIPSLLKLFEDNEIHATWAVVGMLFNENWHEWEKNRPDKIPGYKNSNLSAYNFGDKYRFKKGSHWQCFAPDLIKKIKNTPYQEIGTHTYSHYYCKEDGQDLEYFEYDLEKSKELANFFGIELKSLVFPRNQIDQKYLKICKKIGIENVRSNPANWYWINPESKKLSVKLARTGDAYFPLGKKSYSIGILRKEKELPMSQPASRFLRPVEENKFLKKLKIKKILSEMTTAAKNKEIYHLWWHPHNFGERPKESLDDLQVILNHFKDLKNKYDFHSLNMREIGELVNN